MFYPDDLKRAELLAGQAAEQMRSRRIPPTPQNFEIWYVYQSERNPDLKRRLDQILAQSTDITESLSREIYRRYFTHDSDLDALRETSTKVESAVSRVLTHIGQAGADASEYRQSIEGYTGSLRADVGADELRQLAEGILAESRRMVERSQVVETQLKSSTQEIELLRGELESARRESITDGLTGIPNRRHFDRCIEQAKNDAVASNEPLCLLLLDIDHFKRFNDTHGHHIGDQVLKLVARTLIECIKGRDLAARFGGEEFSVILPKTALDGARSLAATICSAIASKRIVRKKSGEDIGSISLSGGISLFRPGEEVSSLIHRADVALYKAKANGRNQVMLEQTMDDSLASLAAAS